MVFSGRQLNGETGRNNSHLLGCRTLSASAAAASASATIWARRWNLSAYSCSRANSVITRISAVGISTGVDSGNRAAVTVERMLII